MTLEKHDTFGALGTHYLIDFHDCKNLPKNAGSMKIIMENAANLVGAKIVESVFHEFNPYGLSGVVVIAESHFAIHTWPEFKMASLDLFSCRSINPEKGLYYLEEEFGSEDMRITVVNRGIKDKHH